jgi:hypothetical protein
MFRMPPIDEERLKLFEACKAIWPNIYLGEQGQIWLPFKFTIPRGPSRGKRHAPPPVPQPSSAEVPSLVARAHDVIAKSGANASQPATKQQNIDELSYSYGLLWGVACALDCSLQSLLEKLGRPPPKRRPREASRAPKDP